jgi:DNA-binding LacI/PurR family transcriptional regulator
MDISENEAIPLYRKIYTDLKDKIIAGEYPEGSLLPPERQLKEVFKVSHLTVRKALAILVDERFIRRDPGVGTVVVWENNVLVTSAKKLTTLSVILEKMDDFFGEIINAVEDECDKRQIDLRLFSHRNDMVKCQKQYERAAGSDSESVLLIFPPSQKCDWLSFQPGLNRTIIADEFIPGLACPQIISDDEQGMSDLVRYFIDLGHRRIAFIGGDRKSSGILRKRGYVNALENAGIKVLPELIADGGFDAELSYNAFQHLYESVEDIKACVCANDYSALGVMKYLRGKGIDTGKNFALAGYGNYQISEYLGLTSVDQRPELIKRQIFGLIDQYENCGKMPQGLFSISTELKVRASGSALRK